MTHRRYLWLTLVFDIIRKVIRLKSRKLNEIIETITPTVESAYEAILAKFEEIDQQQAQKLLHIIITATRPLTLGKMNIALAVEEHQCSFDDLEPDLDDELRFGGSVRNLCGLFVNVVNQKVYLIHQTAKSIPSRKERGRYYKVT